MVATAVVRRWCENPSGGSLREGLGWVKMEEENCRKVMMEGWMLLAVQEGYGSWTSSPFVGFYFFLYFLDSFWSKVAWFGRVLCLISIIGFLVSLGDFCRNLKFCFLFWISWCANYIYSKAMPFRWGATHGGRGFPGRPTRDASSDFCNTTF